MNDTHKTPRAARPFAGRAALASLAAFVAFTATTLMGSAPVHAQCRDMGAFAVVMGGSVGMGTAIAASAIGGTISSRLYEDVNGWEVFGVGVAAGVGGAVLTSALLGIECPFPEAVWLPSVVSVLASTLAMVLLVELREPSGALSQPPNALPSSKARPAVRGLSFRMGF